MLRIARLIRNLILKFVDFFHFPFLRFIPVETFRYAATGGLNTTFDILLYFLFYNYLLDKQFVDLGFVTISPHIAAFLLVFPITFSTGFLLAKYITFTQSLLRGRIQLFRYGISVGGSILLNYLLLKLFVEVFHLYATLSKILTTLVVIVYSYIIQKHFSFRTGRKCLERAFSEK
ncbi:MAG TPA: GtrA family protein [Prolixibacteraceae bacterium]|nr:GtrA family protein [Prolixibacteraceae bacterium]